jgi:integrase
LIEETLVSPAPQYFLDYLHRLELLFPTTEILFPTTSGTSYRPEKYFARFRHLLALTGIQDTPRHPGELTDEQFKQLICLRFDMQRPWYQMTIVSMLTSHLGLRPSESAKLVKKDLDFGNYLITLRDTKSQEDQTLPILSMMIKPLSRYVSHLSDSDYLFVNFARNQWDRKDVTSAVKIWGNLHGIEHLTSRCLRASLGAMLSRLGVSPALLAKILRHKDPATALRYYNFRELEEARQYLEQVQESYVEDFVYQQEYIRLYKELANDNE